jgi:CHAD domain-containing protein
MELDNTIFVEKMLESYKNLTSNYLQLYSALLEKKKTNTIHDIRVCSRRLITLLNFYLSQCNSYYANNLNKILKFYFRNLSKLRDVQIQIENNQTKSIQSAEWKCFLDYLSSKEKKLKQKINELFTENSRLEIEGLMFFFKDDLKNSINNGEITINDLVSRINQQFKKCILFLQNINIDHAVTIHNFRIEFKKFRYLYELLYPFYHRVMLESKELGKYQTLLGNIQDSEVLLNYIMNYIQKQKGKGNFKELLIEANQQKTKHIILFFEKKDELFKFWDKTLFLDTNTN